jgi:hypothetical protein
LQQGEQGATIKRPVAIAIISGSITAIKSGASIIGAIAVATVAAAITITIVVKTSGSGGS